MINQESTAIKTPFYIIDEKQQNQRPFNNIAPLLPWKRRTFQIRPY